MWKLVCVCPRLSRTMSFQKDLIVWKLEEEPEAFTIKRRFQKDLIVWKLTFYQWLTSYHEFQKDLIVWKLKGVKYIAERKSKFQKDLIVWKRESWMNNVITRKVSEGLNSVETSSGAGIF